MTRPTKIEPSLPSSPQASAPPGYYDIENNSIENLSERYYGPPAVSPPRNQPVYVQNVQPIHIVEHIVEKPVYIETKPEPVTHYVEDFCNGINKLCATCWSGISKIFCFWNYCSINSKDAGCSLLAGICTLICFAIFLGIFLGIVDKDNKYRDPYLQTSCEYLSSQEHLYRCCDRINCQCLQAPSGSPSCSSALSSLIATTCGNGYDCCARGCDRCPYSCNCDEDDDGHKYNCQTCYRDCNCGCRQSVSNAICTIACGTCDTIQTTYAYNTTQGMVQQVFTQNCGRDDLACVSAWKQSHPLNTSSSCWYDSNEPNSGAHLSKPEHKNNIPALAFTIIFGIFMCGCFIWFLLTFECSLENKRYN